MAEPLTFIHVLPSHQVKSEQGYYPKQKPRSLPQTPPVSQKYIKCWCVIWGRPKGLRALSLDQCSGRRGPAQEGAGLTSLVPRGREEGPTSPHSGLGKLMQSWAGKNQKGNWQCGVLRGWKGAGGWVVCDVYPRGEGRNWRDLGKLREWDSPSGAYSCGPAGQPEWPSQIPPAPLPWSWLSTQGSQRH